MKIAIVHDYLNQQGGAERVVGTLHKMFPKAPIYTSIVDRGELWPSLRDADIRPSWMQSLPGLKRHFKKYLLLYPWAIESFDLSAYDLVISSSSAFGKAALAGPNAFHICYCHTPMRFAWDYDRYVEREQFGPLVRALLPAAVGILRRWDLNSASRPNVFVANSTVVRDRIQRFYGLNSEIIFPPVEVDRFGPSEGQGEYYLVLSRLNPYKRIDLAVQAFNELGLPLVVIGDGPDRSTLEAMARPNIRFLGRLPDDQVARYVTQCRGLIFPGEEDFGITPLEINAAGLPVVAYRAGGALDTVVEGKTGVYFSEPSPASLVEAVRKCEQTSWDLDAIRAHAQRFSERAFIREFRALLEKHCPAAAEVVSL